MDYMVLDKEQMKELVSSTAEAKDFELPKSWHLYGQEKMIALAEEIQAYNPEPEKEYAQPKIKGNTSMKDRILAQEKVEVYVPEDQVSGTTHVDIWLNGVHFIYAREKDYMMPKGVAEIFTRSQKAERAARKKMEKFNEIK